MKIFKAEWKTILVAVAMKLTLPALLIVGFMTTITLHQIQEQTMVLAISFLFLWLVMFYSFFVY